MRIVDKLMESSRDKLVKRSLWAAEKAMALPKPHTSSEKMLIEAISLLAKTIRVLIEDR